MGALTEPLEVEPSDPLFLGLTHHARARLSRRLRLPECELLAQLSFGLYLPAWYAPTRPWLRAQDQQKDIRRVVTWSTIDKQGAMLILSTTTPSVITGWALQEGDPSDLRGAPDWLRAAAKRLRLQAPRVLSARGRRLIAQARLSLGRRPSQGYVKRHRKTRPYRRDRRKTWL